MTRRDVQATMQDLLNVDISVGSVQKAWEETADAVEVPYVRRQLSFPAVLPHLRMLPKRNRRCIAGARISRISRVDNWSG